MNIPCILIWKKRGVFDKSFTNTDFLLPQNTQFNRNIIPLLFVFATFRFLFSDFFFHFNQKNNLVLYIFLYIIFL